MSDYNHAMLIEQDKRQLHPLHHPSRAENPAMVVRGDGVWLYTSDGKRSSMAWRGYGM